MGKHKVGMDDYDDSRVGAGYAGEEPRRGVYKGKLISVEDHNSAAGNEGLHWIFEITEGEFKGWRGHQYSNLEKDSTLWKTQQLVHAITRNKKAITINTEERGAALAKKAHPVMLRVVRESYEGEPRAKLNSVLLAADQAASRGNTAPEDDSDDDSDDDEDSDPFA